MRRKKENYSADSDDEVLASNAFDDLRGQRQDIRRSATLARSEAAAGLADAARSFVRGFVDNEPISGSAHWSDVGRRTPRSAARAGQSAVNSLLDVPRRIVDRFYDEYGETRRDRGDKDHHSAKRTVKARRGTGMSGAERRVLDLVDSFLDQVPGDGARLNRVVDHVVLETDYDRGIVTSIVKRNFFNNGNVISKQSTVEGVESHDSVRDYMRDTLKDHGFEDIHTDVELTGLPDLEDEAALVAYVSRHPAVLCYPVDKGDVEDSGLQEAAIFQANVIAPGEIASFVWISDGDDSYIYDVVQDQIVTKLPQASEISTPSRPAGARSRSTSSPSSE